MGALMRAYDWSGSPLGTPETWPQSLRTAVRICSTPTTRCSSGGVRDSFNSITTPIARPWDPSAIRARLAERGREVLG